MRIELKEFDDIKTTELYLNDKIFSKSMANYTITPYSVEPNVINYLVSCLIIEESDKQNEQNCNDCK